MSHFRSKSVPSRAAGQGRLHALVAEQLKAYQDNELPGWRHWLLSRHLSRCAECRKEITQLKRVCEEMRTLPQAMPRPELRARILASLPDSPPQRARTRISIPMATTRFALACALCGLLLLSVWAIGRGHHSANESRLGLQTTPQVVTAPTMPQRTAAKPDNGAAPTAVDGNRTTDNLASDNISSNSSIPAASSMPNTPSNPTTPSSMAVTALDSRADQEQYTDPTSIAAEKIMHQKDVVDEVERKILRDRHEADRQQRLADAAAAQVRRTLSKSGQTSLQLAVADVAAAHDHLLSVVQSLGGNLTEANQDQSAKAHQATADAPAHPTGDPIGAAGTPVMATATVISIRVPASAASRLQSTLRQLGAVAQWQASSANSDAQAQKSSVMTPGSIPKNQSAVSPHTPKNAYTNTRVPSKMREYAPTPLPGESDRDVIIFTVRLQAAGNAAH